MAGPQYYQYSYAGVTARPSPPRNGDLNGDTPRPLFHQDGAVVGGRLNVAPSITEVGAEE